MLDVVTVRSRADIDGLPKFDTIRELRILASDLEDLSGLECVTHVENLYVDENDSLRTLSGLDNLVRVGPLDSDQPADEEIAIRDNSALESLSGLDALEEVYASFYIVRNDALRNINDLDSLRIVDHTLEVSDNEALEEIYGLTAYEGMDYEGEPIGGELVIERNPRLTTVDLGADVVVQGLRVSDNRWLSSVDLHLSSVWRTYEISNNPLLAELPGVRIGEELDELLIANNDSLVSLRGFESGPSRFGHVHIVDNEVLPSLRWLWGVRSVSWLRIENNPTLLTLDDIGSLDQLETLDGTLTVRNNTSLPSCKPQRLEAQLRELGNEFVSEISNNGPDGRCS
jgi:hypothetical protein